MDSIPNDRTVLWIMTPGALAVVARRRARYAASTPGL
jgi:hypothetical protein